MKKIIVLILSLFVSILVINANEKIYLEDSYSDICIKGNNKGIDYEIKPHIIKNSNNKVLYSITPFKLPENNEHYNLSDSNLTKEQLDKINLIAYYGYNYTGHEDLKWYLVTQFLIWKTVGVDNIYFKDNLYVNEINELEKTVNKYFKLPSFSGATKIVGINSSKVFKDENNVLDYFEIEYSDIDANIVDNNLKINAKEEGIYTIGFIKKSPLENNYSLYNKGDISLISSGKINDIRFNITIKVVSGSITVIAVDSENKDRLEANLQNFNVDLYKGNIGVGSIYIDENNNGSRYDLTFGEYKVKNGQTPYGYKFKSIEEWIYIWEGSYNINVYLNYEVIKGNLIINKYCDNEIDNEAEFEIYHNDILVKKIHGNSYEKLEYGTYLVKQVNGNKNYNFIEDFTITINEEKDYVYDLESGMVKEVDSIINNNDLELKKLQQEILNKENELSKAKELLLEKEKEISKYKEILKVKSNEVIEYLKEIEMLKNELIKKEEINKELKLMKQKTLTEEKEVLFEAEEGMLVVNVPDTYKKNNNKFISKIFIIVGLILIIINFIYKKKTILK